jgi:hypothetical protein
MATWFLAFCGGVGCLGFSLILIHPIYDYVRMMIPQKVQSREKYKIAG